MIVNISFRIDIDDFSADTNPCDARGSWLFRSNSSIIIFIYIYIFAYDQTSMSALQFPIPVTRKLIAATVRARTAVFVNRGSLEMGQLVKVKNLIITISLLCRSESYKVVSLYLSFRIIRHR